MEYVVFDDPGSFYTGYQTHISKMNIPPKTFIPQLDRMNPEFQQGVYFYAPPRAPLYDQMLPQQTFEFYD